MARQRMVGSVEPYDGAVDEMVSNLSFMKVLNRYLTRGRSNEAIERSADEDPVFDLVVGLMGLTGRLFNFSDPVSSYGWMKRAAWELNGLVDRVPGDLFPDNIPNSSRNEICNTILSVCYVASPPHL
jgi:hypothetical protein